jgi:hypothetical protein
MTTPRQQLIQDAINAVAAGSPVFVSPAPEVLAILDSEGIAHLPYPDGSGLEFVPNGLQAAAVGVERLGWAGDPTLLLDLIATAKGLFLVKLDSKVQSLVTQQAAVQAQRDALDQVVVK